MAQEPIQRVAQSDERIHDQRSDRRCGGDDRGDVAPDCVRTNIACAFDRRASQQANALRIPIDWTQSVDADGVSVTVAIRPVALYFPELEDGVAILSGQKQFSIVGHRLQIGSP